MPRTAFFSRVAAATALLLAVAAMPSSPGPSAAHAAAAAAAAKPLAGTVVVVDPGHQLGNSRHLKEIGRIVKAGGLSKPCNTVGAQTTSGYRESAFNLSVAKHLERRLVAQGATVHLTRSTESKDLWGPCVDVRGRSAGLVKADVLVSIHADNAPSRYHGFFVIRPAYRKSITDDIHASSRTLSRDLRAGLDKSGVPRANYLGGDGLDTRNDLGTLNLSSAPAVMVELGNMRNPRDAAHMKDDRYRDDVYAAGLARGVRSYLTR